VIVIGELRGSGHNQPRNVQLHGLREITELSARKAGHRISQNKVESDGELNEETKVDCFSLIQLNTLSCTRTGRFNNSNTNVVIRFHSEPVKSNPYRNVMMHSKL